MITRLKALILIVCWFFAALLFAPIAEKGVSATLREKKQFCIVIDAGHGGIDGGVCGKNSKVPESEINLAVAKKLCAAFENAAFKVIMTRNSENGLYGAPTFGYKKRDMQKRAEIIKSSGADLFISIHQNYYSDSARRGAQVFFFADKDRQFALEVQKSLNGMPEAARSCEAIEGNYFVLKQAKCPACLIECGFLSNADDEKRLLDEGYREKLVSAIFCGCLKYLTGSESAE